MKGALLEPQDRADFKESMKGIRYVRSYGEFYNLKCKTGRHVYFPCPRCGVVNSGLFWSIVMFLIWLKMGHMIRHRQHWGVYAWKI